MAKYFYLERIASEEECKRVTTTERFCDRAVLVLNSHLRGGGWIDLLTSSMSLRDFKDAIKEQYPVIDDEIISRLVFCHYKHVCKDVTTTGHSPARCRWRGEATR